MALKIRLARRGNRNRPFYHIVVADARAPRDGNFIEKIGTYNPLAADSNESRINFDTDRAKHWLSQGAQPSERVARFLGQAGVIEMPKINERPQKSAPGKKAQDRAEERREKEEARKAAEAEAAAEAKAAKEAPAAEEKPAEDAPAADTPAEEAAAAEDKKADDAA